MVVCSIGGTVRNAFVVFFAWLPHVVGALAVLLSGYFVAKLVAALVTRALAGGIATVVDRTMGDTSLGRIARAAAPVLIMAIAVFMILEQLKIATAIVTITYAALLGAIALGSALAFGLGGREVAGELLRGAVDKGRESSGQMKRELRQGRENARQEIADSPLTREAY